MHGGIYASMFAMSDGVMLAAELRKEDTSPIPAAGVLAAMALHAEADTIAIVAEAWLRHHDPGDDIPVPGELAARAETDPDVKTAIIVHGMDVASGDRLTAVATAFLDDEGQPDWECAYAMVPMQLPADPLRLARATMGQIRRPESFAHLIDVAANMGFTVVEVPG